MIKKASAYSETFKASCVQKAINRSDGVTVADVAAECQIGLTTLTRWIKASDATSLASDGSKSANACKQTEIEGRQPSRLGREKRPKDWTSEERLQAIIDTDTLTEEALGAYCRSRGLYPHHLRQWRSQLTSKSTPDGELPALKRLKSEKKQLQRELARKEQALAEMAALLVLQKKARDWLADGEVA